MTDFVLNGDITLLPEGVYRVSDTIVLGGALVKGAGIDKTVLVADFDDPKKPIFNMGWTSKLEGLTICYKDGLISGEEKFGERVAIYTGSHLPLQKGAYIRDVKIDNVGTGIFAIDWASIAFSVMFDRVTVTNFSFRGFDISAPYRTGNIYSGINLSSGRFRCDSAFYFGLKESGDEESETTIKDLLIYDTRARIPLNIESAKGLIADNITLQGVDTSGDCLVYWRDSDGRIEKLTIRDSSLVDKTVVKIGTTSKHTIWGCKYFHLGTLRLQGITGASRNSLLVGRPEEVSDRYYTYVDKLEVADCVEADLLETFPANTEIFRKEVV